MMCNLVASQLVNEITVHSTFVGKKKKKKYNGNAHVWSCFCLLFCDLGKKKANKKPVPLNVEYKVILQIVSLSIMAKFGLFLYVIK